MQKIPKHLVEYGNNIKKGYVILRNMFCGEPENGRFDLQSRSQEDKMFLPLIAIPVGGFVPGEIDRLCSDKYFTYLSSITKSETDAKSLIESNLNQYRDKLCKTIMKCYNLASAEINQYDTSEKAYNMEDLASKNSKMENILKSLKVKIISPFEIGKRVVVNGDVFNEIDYKDIALDHFSIAKIVGTASGKKLVDQSSTYGCVDASNKAIVKSNLVLREVKVSRNSKIK